MKRGMASVLAMALLAGTADGPVDVPRRVPARRPYPRPTKHKGPKNRTRETDRRRRQIAAGMLRATGGRAQRRRS